MPTTLPPEIDHRITALWAGLETIALARFDHEWPEGHADRPARLAMFHREARLRRGQQPTKSDDQFAEALAEVESLRRENAMLRDVLADLRAPKGGAE